MNKPTHTPGPLKCWFAPYVTDSSIGEPDRAAFVVEYQADVDSWPKQEQSARLLAAAYNAFDSTAKRLNVNGVELAERMQEGGIADLLESLADILSRFRSCIAQGNGEIEGDEEAIAKAEMLLAIANGTAS